MAELRPAGNGGRQKPPPTHAKKDADGKPPQRPSRAAAAEHRLRGVGRQER